MISDDNRIFKIFKNFFSIAVSDLKIPSQCNYFNKKTHSLPTILKTFENRVPVFSQISFIKILTTSLIKVNFSMI